MPAHFVILTRAALAALLFLTIYIPVPALAQVEPAAPTQTGENKSSATHKVAIHVDDNDPRVMNLALNNAKNVLDYYEARNETVLIEIVAYGPGLHMLRSDTSPVKQRVGEMAMAPQISFAACGNTRANMAKQEAKDVPLRKRSAGGAVGRGAAYGVAEAWLRLHTSFRPVNCAPSKCLILRNLGIVQEEFDRRVRRSSCCAGCCTALLCLPLKSWRSSRYRSGGMRRN